MKSRYLLPDVRDIYINDLTKELVKKIDIYLDENMDAEETKDLQRIIKTIIDRETIYPKGRK